VILDAKKKVTFNHASSAIIILIIATAFAIDPSVYNSYQTPKLVLFVAIPLASIIIIYFYRLVKKETLTLSISIIEGLLFIQLLWYVLCNPSMLTDLHNPELFFLISFLLVVLIVRQIQVGEQKLLRSFPTGSILDNSWLHCFVKWIITKIICCNSCNS